MNNLKHILMHQWLCSCGPNADLVQCVHDCMNIMREAMGLLVGHATVAHVPQVLENDAEYSELDIFCSRCLSGETTEQNDILIGTGDCSDTVAYHQNVVSILLCVLLDYV